MDKKSNIIIAIPQFSKALVSSGYIVTVGAIRCQTKINKIIVDQDADFLLSVMEYTGCPYEDAKLLLDNSERSDFTIGVSIFN
ncbi:MAG: hypothetical protein ACK2TV_04720 [Anaerolineales bacterium]